MEQINKHQDATTPSCLEGKTVLVISSGGFCQRFVWDDYQTFGLKIVLVDHNVLCYGSEKASYFFQYDFKDHRNDDQHATNIITILQEKQLKVDGCITFWDDCGPLTAIIRERLGLHGCGKEAAQVAKSKISTHNILDKRVGDRTNTSKYSAKCYRINNLSDIDNALSYVGIPAVIKPEHGFNSIGVTSLKESEEGKDIYLKLKSLVMNDHAQRQLGYGDRFMLMEYLYGTQHAIDIVLFQGEMVFALVTDMVPYSKRNFAHTAASMPTSLGHLQEEQIKAAAYQCFSGIGLTHGVFTADMKMTPEGPKLIEINGRMAGQFARDWTLHCYGIDLLLISFMVCVNIRPENIKPTAKFQIMGILCLPSEHKEQFEKHETLELLNGLTRREIIRYNPFALSVDECGNEGNEMPFCSIAVVDSSITIAKQKLLRVCDSLGLTTANYDVNSLLNEFTEH